MFHCRRCGAVIDVATKGAPMACPECLAVDGILAPLTVERCDPLLETRGARAENAIPPTEVESN